MGILKAGRPTGRTKNHIADHIKDLEKKCRLNVNLSQSEYSELKQFCMKNRTNISEFIRTVILEKINSQSFWKTKPYRYKL